MTFLDVLLFLYSAVLVMWVAALTKGLYDLRCLIREIYRIRSRAEAQRQEHIG